MFPVFPVSFPVRSQSGPMDCCRSQCSEFPDVTTVSVLPLSMPYIQQPGTPGTLGTGLKRDELDLSRLTEQTWNTGNK